MIPRPARIRSPSTAQASQSSVTIAVVGTGTMCGTSDIATSQPPMCVDRSSAPRPRSRARADARAPRPRSSRAARPASRAPTGSRPSVAPRSAPLSAGASSRRRGPEAARRRGRDSTRAGGAWPGDRPIRSWRRSWSGPDDAHRSPAHHRACPEDRTPQNPCGERALPERRLGPRSTVRRETEPGKPAQPHRLGTSDSSRRVTTSS